MPRRSAAAAALPPDADVEDRPIPTPAEYRLVALEQILESPLNPRKHRGDDPEIGTLARSIAAYGILEPLVVRAHTWNPGGDPATFEIVAGSRRFKAAGLAGLTEVPVTIRDVTDAQLLVLALEENTKRRAMHPLDEAEALDKLMALDRVYQDPKVLAAKLGRSETYVRDRRRLLNLIEPVVAALDANAITVKHAELIGTVPQEQQLAALAQCFSALIESDDDDDLPTRESLIEAGNWMRLAPALKGTRDLAEWVKSRGKADVVGLVRQGELEMPAEPADAREDADETIDPVEFAKSLLQLSTDRGFLLTRKDAKAIGVISADDYTVVKRAKDRCEHTRRGAIVHGSDFRGQGSVVELVDVCVNKRGCGIHWPNPGLDAKKKQSATKAKAAEDYKREQEKAEAERKAWDAERPALQRAVGALVAKRKLKLLDVVRDHYGTHAIDRVAQDYGVRLTEPTIPHFLALYGAHLGFHARHFFLADAKRVFGLTTKELEAEVARQAKAAAAAPTKGKAAKKGKRR